MTTFWMRADGSLILATSDPKAEPPDAVASTEIAPESGKQIWDFSLKLWLPFTPEGSPITAEELWEVLRAKGLINDADVPVGRRQPPRGA